MTVLDDLSRRASFWTTHHAAACQGDSPATPFEALPSWRSSVEGRSVLEIGPGEGRQAAALMPLASSYAVADISGEVLSRPLYAGASRHLIRAYARADLGMRFDTVMFWYVLHHVLRAEAPAFLGFVARHVGPGGEVLFNAPVRSRGDGLAGGDGDGMKTTRYGLDEVRALVSGCGLHVVDEADQHACSYVIRARQAG